MATQLARPHGHLSNRAKVRSAVERKPVVKSVLESPFQISWPSVPKNVQNIALARLVAALENIPFRVHSSGKSLQKTGIPGQQAHANITPEQVGNNSISLRMLDQACPDRVSGALHLVVGINAVTRALEHQLCLTRVHVVGANTSQNGDQLPPRSAPSPVAVVFVCSADVDPAALVAHIPYLVAGCNSPKNVNILQPIKAAVVAFRHGSPLSETFRDILESVPTVSAPWLCPLDTGGAPQFVPTHIKQLRTMAPKDVKVAREQRAKARTAAKRSSPSSARPVRRKSHITLTTG